jgi:hypothetical protein
MKVECKKCHGVLISDLASLFLQGRGSRHLHQEVRMMMEVDQMRMVTMMNTTQSEGLQIIEP